MWPSGAATSLVGPSAATGGWHHIVYTYDGTTDIIYVDGSATSGSYTHQTGTPTAAWIGTFNGSSEFLAGAIDDVRVYNVALTAAQVAQLAAGRYAGTGGQSTVKLGGNTTVTNQLTIDNGILDANGKTMAATLAAAVNIGTYNVNSAAQTFSGGLTVQPSGTLTLANSGGSVLLGSGTTLTIDGTLNASSTGATIKSASGHVHLQGGLVRVGHADRERVRPGRSERGRRHADRVQHQLQPDDHEAEQRRVQQRQRQPVAADQRQDAVPVVVRVQLRRAA